MSVTYEWDVESIDVVEALGDAAHVVCRVVWKCTATDGEKSKSMIGVQDLNIDNIGDTFIPYDELTKEQILEWTKVWLNVPAIEKSILPNVYTKSFAPDTTPLPETSSTGETVVVEPIVPGDPGQV
jgi:hypothetical protein